MKRYVLHPGYVYSKNDGDREGEILRERYKEELAEYSEHGRVIWELGFDFGVDDEGADEFCY